MNRATPQKRTIAVLVVAFVAACGLYTRSVTAAESAAVAAGREIAHDVYLGNCLGCHRIPGDPKAISLATIGPPIVDMRSRYPDRQVLRQQIWDSMLRNPHTVMPPFGKHGVLTEQQIDLVVEYIYQY
jgi:sulfur-oxidizing protein SoxX